MGNPTAGRVSVSKSLVVLLALVSLAVAVLMTFDADTLAEFLKSAALLGTVIFSTLRLLAASALYLIRKEPTKVGRAVLGALALPIVASAVLVAWGEPPGFSPHFSTNILTGRCDFVTTYGPWYHRPGCGLSREEKVRLAMGSRRYYKEFCTTTCTSDVATCRVRPLPGEDILCSDLMR